MKINYKGIEITLNDDAYYEYCSHINGIQCINPNNYVKCTGTSNSKNYEVWYYIENTYIELDEIDYNNPSHIKEI